MPTDDRLDALRGLGWDGTWVIDTARGRPARVARVDRGAATVLDGARVLRASLDSAPSDVATGDWVVIDDGDGGGVTTHIVDVLPRRSSFVRGDPFQGVAREAQVVASNIDVVFVVHSLSNGPNVRRLERELVLAFESGASPVVVLTKRDLVSSAAEALDDVAQVAPNTPVVVTSAVTGEGVDRLRAHAAGGRTVALIGASGVGKSTLVNRLVGSAVQATNDVRASDQRGRHTTTARELIVLPGGGVLIDTPGLRAVSLWDADEGLERAFADIVDLSSGCRFRDCRHDAEPDCAVRAAVRDGTLAPERLASYQRLLRELDDAFATDERQRRRRRR